MARGFEGKRAFLSKLSSLLTGASECAIILWQMLKKERKMPSQNEENPLFLPVFGCGRLNGVIP
jgi:hypothetical protein